MHDAGISFAWGILAAAKVERRVYRDDTAFDEIKAQRSGKQDIVSIADEDIYFYPAGKRLTYRFTREERAKPCTAIGRQPVPTVHPSPALKQRVWALSEILG